MSGEPISKRRARLLRALPQPIPPHFNIRLALASRPEAEQVAARNPLAVAQVGTVDVVSPEAGAPARVGQLMPGCACWDCPGRCLTADCTNEQARRSRSFMYANPVEVADEGPDAPVVPTVFHYAPQAAEPGELIAYCKCTDLFGRCDAVSCADCPFADIKRGRDYFGLRPR